MTSTTAVPASTAVVLSDAQRKQVVELLRQGKTPIEVAAAINALPTPAVKAKVPTTYPITKEQRAALRKLPQVYGQVVLEDGQPRQLTDEELYSLAEERQVIDQILAFLKVRKEDAIKHTASIHFDKKVEAQYGKQAAKIKKDEYGHYLVKQEQDVPELGVRFTRELRETKPGYSNAGWKAAYEAGDITAEMYIAMTDDPEQTRPINPAKAQAYIVDHPEALVALAKYGTTPGSTGASIYLRKQ